MMCALVLCVTGVLGACTDARPCEGCPVVSGGWNVTFGAPAIDAGCAEAAPANGPLSLEQAESALRGDFAGQQLNGTLYDTYDFTLRSGPSATPNYALRGRFVPGAADAGEQLTGTLTSEVSADGGTDCVLTVPFTATR